MDYSSIISTRYYNRESELYGKYKVIEFIENRGVKSNIPYFLIKFEDSGNTIECNLKTILTNTPIDIERKKKETKRKNRLIKKEKKEAIFNNKRCIEISGEFKLLALDLSSHSTGYAIFDNDKLIKYGYFYQSKSVEVTQRWNYMKKEILKLIDTYNITIVSIEDIIFKNKIALSVLSKGQGIILDNLYERNIKFNLITPKQWKSCYGIDKEILDGDYEKRTASKLKTIEKIKFDFGIFLDEEFKDYPSDLSEPSFYDVADAISIGKMTIDNFLIKI